MILIGSISTYLFGYIFIWLISLHLLCHRFHLLFHTHMFTSSRMFVTKRLARIASGDTELPPVYCVLITCPVFFLIGDHVLFCVPSVNFGMCVIIVFCLLTLSHLCVFLLDWLTFLPCCGYRCSLFFLWSRCLEKLYVIVLISH